jgi:hypothetical protein
MKWNDRAKVQEKHDKILAAVAQRLHAEQGIKIGVARLSHLSRLLVYAFFLCHMLFFGGREFWSAYFDPSPTGPSYISSGFAIPAYVLFYQRTFGVDAVKWMFINAALGMFGVYSGMGQLLSFFGKTIGDYPVHFHVIPGIYYVMYTFLLRQFLLDSTGSRSNPDRRKVVESAYVGLSLLVYGWLSLLPA